MTEEETKLLAVEISLVMMKFHMEEHPKTSMDDMAEAFALFLLSFIKANEQQKLEDEHKN